MATIKEAYRKVKALNVTATIRESVEAVKDQYAEENKRQLHEGFNKKGERLKEYRSPVYAEVKNRLNPIPGEGNPDFEVTGAFTNNREVSVQGGEIVTKYNDSKADELLARDPGITGLVGEYKREFVNESLRPAFRSEIRKRINL